MEETGFSKQAPWLKNPIEFNTIGNDDDNSDRAELVAKYDQILQDIALQTYIIGYSNGSKLDNQNIDAGLYLIDGTSFIEVRKEYS